MRLGLGLSLFLTLVAQAETVKLTGLKSRVEILRDTWGVPHIYAQNQDDLFFAQGWITARDRLFQIDMWRRVGTGKLAEVLGPRMLARDRLARLVRFRGDWAAEWTAYSPDSKQIATAFTSGVNAYIKSLNGQRTAEFKVAGYDPGLWVPEDVTARIAGLLMLKNAVSEVQRALDIRMFGIEKVQRLAPPDPYVKFEIPKGLDLASIRPEILKDYREATGAVRFADSDAVGSNNWVVDGTMSATGKPLLANDPHRPILTPSLRKTVHLVAPGWNAIGAGEPALPGIALGHNDEIAFGFTIVGIDQQDIYVEKLKPGDPNLYLDRGKWRAVEAERTQIAVKGEATSRPTELRYTHHGPVIYEDRAAGLAYALKWVGAEPGGAGYLAALGLSRAKNWQEFRKAVANYLTPSENLVYADRAGNIGWIASGRTPIRKNWSGLLPVPGHTGEYEWSGYLSVDQMPQSYNPAGHFIATANHNILPKGYSHQLSYEWADPSRALRVKEMLSEKKKFTVEDFSRMQQDVVSLEAKRFVKLLAGWAPPAQLKAAADRMKNWNASLDAGSWEALVYQAWMLRMPLSLLGQDLARRYSTRATMIRELEANRNDKALSESLTAALKDLETGLGSDQVKWKWGVVHVAQFNHPLRRPEFSRASVARPGDSSTVNATSWTAGTGTLRQTNGASYRQVIDLADWDRSVMTNVPGESGDPSSKHYADLIADWAAGKPHPMPYSRKAVEAATAERIELVP